MKLKQALQTFADKIIYAAIYVVSLLPLAFLYPLGSVAFFLCTMLSDTKKKSSYKISHVHSRKAIWRDPSYYKKFYACFTSYFPEIIKTVSAPTEELNDGMFFQNLDLIEHHIQAKRNVIACMGHCGNWELLNLLPYRLQHPTYAVYKPLKSALINRLMIKIRSRFGMKLTSKAYLFIERHFPGRD